MARQANNSDIVVLSETEVNKVVKNYFTLNNNVQVYRRNIGGVADRSGHWVQFGKAGQSDFWGIVKEVRCPVCKRILARGVHVEIECKRYKGKLSNAQREYLSEMRAMNAITMVAMPEPSKDDPTGVMALKGKLEWLDKRICPACQREGKTEE